MNFKIELTEKQQNLLKQIDIKVEDKNYTKEEIKNCINDIASHIMSQSSKNGDLSKEINKYDELIKILIKNER